MALLAYSDEHVASERRVVRHECSRTATKESGLWIDWSLNEH